MTLQGWRELVLSVAWKCHDGDDRSVDLLAQLLWEQDAAKQILRDKGYGCTGMGWLETVAEIPSTDQ